jgi:hypothetical protein
MVYSSLKYTELPYSFFVILKSLIGLGNEEFHNLDASPNILMVMKSRMIGAVHINTVPKLNEPVVQGMITLS